MEVSSTITIEAAKKILWDVIIIGAGPAGSFCAGQLAKKGLKVLLVDKNTHPRDKVCGGCINPQGVSILRQHNLLEALLPYSSSVNEMMLYSQNRLKRITLFPGLIVDRPLLDAILIQRCIKEGVHLLLNTVATPKELSAAKASVTLTSKDEAGIAFSHVVVGASGLQSATDGSTPSGKNAYIGVSTTLETSPLSSDSIHMGVHSNGYVGAVSLPDKRTHIAAALPAAFIKNKKGISNAVELLIKQSGMITDFHFPVSHTPSPWKGTPTLSRHGIISSTRYFSVGDACGYVEPFTGEGITWALESSLLAAPLIQKAAQYWDDSYSHSWHTLHKETIGKHHRFCTLTKHLLRMPPSVIHSALSFAVLAPSLIQKASVFIGAKAPSWIAYEN